MKKLLKRLNKFKLSLHAVHLKSLNRVFPPIQLITHKITIACHECNDTSGEKYFHDFRIESYIVGTD